MRSEAIEPPAKLDRYASCTICEQSLPSGHAQVAPGHEESEIADTSAIAKRKRKFVSMVLVLAMLGTTSIAMMDAVESPERIIQPEETSWARAKNKPAEDYPLDDGHFYHQGAESHSLVFGYTVTGALWQAFDRVGGVPALGFPVSQPWRNTEGRWTQAFQRGLLEVVSPDVEVVEYELLNVLDILSAAGHDPWLELAYRAPPADGLAAAEPKTASSLLPRNVRQEALAMLDQDPAIRGVFLRTPDWATRFGLPVALGRSGDVVTLRAQRAILRHYLVDVPHAAAGTVLIIDSGTLAKTSGLVPEVERRPVPSPPLGWLRIDGHQIVDGSGRRTRLAGVNWSGFELVDFVPRGLAVRDYAEIIDLIAGLGFNTIRLPFSNELVERNPTPNPDFVAACDSCRGLPALEIMDKIVDYAGQKGLRVILDNHFSAASDREGSALWYTSAYPEDVWLKHWELLAERYRGNLSVIGFDLRNEPHGSATWGSGDPTTDWRLAAEKAGEAILRINPDALIIVEGIERFPRGDGGMDLTWWGGNLQGARLYPVRLPEANLIYSLHEYGPSLYRQGWFNSATTAESLLGVWSRNWAYLNFRFDKPLLIGEFGTGNLPWEVVDNVSGSQGQWFRAMVDLLTKRDNLHWLYWTIDADDPFALLDSAYMSVVSPAKLEAIKPVMGNLFPQLPEPQSSSAASAARGEELRWVAR